MSLYPLLLDPLYLEKVWGGRALERLGRALPGGSDMSIGESWELADVSATSPSGAGGGEVRSRIGNGPLVKRTLHEVVADFGAMVSGGFELGTDGAFPLLLKYLDARENLSVQVHPSPTYAAEHADAHLKSEGWYVVAAEPGAVIYKGLAPGVDEDSFRRAIADGSVADLLARVPARPGDFHWLPSGTVHALGGGVVVAEVQTPSDTTFRVFDWGRTDRELHVEQAMACIDFESATEPDGGMHEDEGDENLTEGEVDGARLRTLIECEHFTVREWSLPAGWEGAFASERASVHMWIEGAATLGWGTEASRELRVDSARTVLLPAALERVDVRTPDGARLLEITPP